MPETDQKNLNQQSGQFGLATVSELIREVQPIPDDTPILHVLQLFQNEAQLFALPILDQQQRFCGIISRRHFLNLMTRAFARELYARKSLAYLMKSHREVFTTPLIVHVDQRIDQVMLEFLRRDPGIQYDALPVVKNRVVLGIIKVADMMLKLTKAQGRLIRAMQQLSARLNDEVMHAATLQRNLLRPAVIELPGISGLSTMITASEVGGDFYDYYSVGQRWAVLLVGDVSGHGIAAGTIVCAAKAAVHFLQLENIVEPQEILSRLNSVIYSTAHQSLLMTMFVMTVDTANGEVRYANAGHQFAYLYRSTLGILEALEIGGLPLGKTNTVNYELARTEMDLGDRLFLYTDAIVEEENAAGECFGYDRLEALLQQQAETDIASLHDRLLSNLREFTGRQKCEDDMTLFCVEYCERMLAANSASLNGIDAARQPTLVDEDHYRIDPAILKQDIARQELIFLGEASFIDLIPALARQGVRRVLSKSHLMNQHLGWEKLLHQHHHHHHFNNDLAAFLHAPEHNREFHFSHSEDKSFIIDEIAAWLEELSLPLPERIDEVVFLLDEVIENGLYAAPRDGKGRALFAKGTVRQLPDDESLRLVISLQQGVLGLALIDSWGTLTPQIFLDRLSHHAQGLGMEAGVGGGGLYLMWRMADYLQIRVVPNLQTQVSMFLDLNNHHNDEIDKGFQFLYHTEVEEAVNYA
jgi:serine phosphatase RsbU (regulator of sigma subunit)